MMKNTVYLLFNGILSEEEKNQFKNITSRKLRYPTSADDYFTRIVCMAIKENFWIENFKDICQIYVFEENYGSNFDLLSIAMERQPLYSFKYDWEKIHELIFQYNSRYRAEEIFGEENWRPMARNDELARSIDDVRVRHIVNALKDLEYKRFSAFFENRDC
jgi:hypothetical protein